MDRTKTPDPRFVKRRHNDAPDSQASAHRRRTDEDAVLHLHGRVSDCESSIEKLLVSHRDMAENMASLNLNLGRVADVLEALGNLKGFWLTFKLMSAVAKATMPLLALAGALLAAVWLFVKTGQWRG
ncbi:MAG: hypothetical protein M0Q15_15830 [Nevskia sp.]|jgi:hypothetical protein|nr:hypothetical protein [Nevskia sp.]